MFENNKFHKFIARIEISQMCFCIDCRMMIDHIYYNFVEHDKRKREEQGIYNKKKIPNNLRTLVYRRDDFTCQRCNEQAVDERGMKRLRIKYIHPENKGGEMVLENLQTSCVRCIFIKPLQKLYVVK